MLIYQYVIICHESNQFYNIKIKNYQPPPPLKNNNDIGKPILSQQIQFSMNLFIYAYS